MSVEKCTHRKYNVITKMMNVHMKEIGSFQMILKISVKCPDCGESFVFHGRPGFSTIEATVTNNYLELMVPMDYPRSEEDEEFQPTQNPPEGMVH